MLDKSDSDPFLTALGQISKTTGIDFALISGSVFWLN
jgi:hypothetical protein